MNNTYSVFGTADFMKKLEDLTLRGTQKQIKYAGQLYNHIYKEKKDFSQGYTKVQLDQIIKKLLELIKEMNKVKFTIGRL